MVYDYIIFIVCEGEVFVLYCLDFVIMYIGQIGVKNIGCGLKYVFFECQGFGIKVRVLRVVGFWQDGDWCIYVVGFDVKVMYGSGD